jgi:sugar O-acyltransferase (sialic acid O-acetyltransferase NeuD family)
VTQLNRYLLLGAGDLARETARILHDAAGALGERCAIAAYNDRVLGSLEFGHQCLSVDQALDECPPSEWQAIGCLGSPRLRESMYLRFRQAGYRFGTAIHPQATVLADEIGPGCIVFPGARIAIGARLGEDVVVNYNAGVGHDCIIGAHSNISPGVQLGGHIQGGKRVVYGIGSSVLQGQRIEDDATIAAGSSVWSHVPAGMTMIGVPAVARRMPGRKPAAAVTANDASKVAACAS